MKKILYILPLLAIFGCSNFLDEQDQDKLVPEKTDHFAALLLQEFNSQYPIFTTIDHMTDNVVEDANALTSSKFGAKTTYTWQREIEIDENGNNVSNINNSWERTYEDIAITNYVINLIDGALGEQSERDYIKGEAYFIRALSYFNLVNLYGQPFNPASADFDLGVPLRTEIGVETTYNRNTVAECYLQIENDLTQAKNLIVSSGLTKSKWHPSKLACDLLMSRIKLYQQKWDNVIESSTEVINNSRLTMLSATTPFITANNPEVLYSFYTVAPLFPLYSTATTLRAVSYRANTQLINLYQANDIRKQAFFLAVDDGTGRIHYRTKKYQKDVFSNLGFANFRTAEAYLNRAEAYAKKNEVTNAINDIKELHKMRYSNTAAIVYPTTQNEVLAFILSERRKELCFEDHHRWFDLRRMENRPEIKHVFTMINNDGVKSGTETYTLLSNDLNYTLPIPMKERQNNPIIRNNERYEKIPKINEEIIIN